MNEYMKLTKDVFQIDAQQWCKEIEDFINENFEKNIFTHIQFFLRNFFLANLIIESGQNNSGIGRSGGFQNSDFGFERTRCSGFAKERVVTFSFRNSQ